MAGRNGHSSGASESGLIELPNMMACEEAELLISKRLDGELSSADIPRLDAHLNECGNCRSTLDSWQDHSQQLDESLDALWTKPAETDAAQPTRAQLLSEKTLRTTVVRRAVSTRQKPARNCMWVPVGMAASQALAFVFLTVYFVCFQPKAEAPQAMLPPVDENAALGRVRLSPPPEGPVAQDKLPEHEKFLPAPMLIPPPAPKSFARDSEEWPTSQPWNGVDPRTPQNVVMATFDTTPPELLDNVSVTFNVEMPDGTMQHGRLRLLGDPASGRAVVRVIDAEGVAQDVAQRDIETLIDPALKPVVKRFLEACANPTLRARLQKLPSDAR